MVANTQHASSALDLPVYRDVEHEVLPLGFDPVRAMFRSFSLASITVHIEHFGSRLWFQERQSGGTIYFGLMIPRCATLRYNQTRIDKPTLVCWHGVDQQISNYVVEAGTSNYMIELPLAEAQARGWSFPPPEHLPIDALKASTFTRYLDDLGTYMSRDQIAFIDAHKGNVLTALDAVTENRLYRRRSTVRPHSSNRYQRIVTDALVYLETASGSERVSAHRLARELEISKRTLFTAFESQLGMGPNKVHRLSSLYRLHRLLCASDHRVVTVSALMHEVGFSQLGRASVAYKAHFGEKPSETLRDNHRVFDST